MIYLIRHSCLAGLFRFNLALVISGPIDGTGSFLITLKESSFGSVAETNLALLWPFLH